jgi:hypothetical protein
MSPIVEVVDLAAAHAGERESDRIAWNLPRRPGDTDTYGASITSDFESGLDWDAFSARYFPASRRHNLRAIVAYGAHKRASPHGSEKAEMPERVIGEAPLETELGASGAGIPRNTDA